MSRTADPQSQRTPSSLKGEQRTCKRLEDASDVVDERRVSSGPVVHLDLVALGCLFDSIKQDVDRGLRVALGMAVPATEPRIQQRRLYLKVGGGTHRTGTRREVKLPGLPALAIASSPASFVSPYKFIGLHELLISFVPSVCYASQPRTWACHRVGSLRVRRFHRKRSRCRGTTA